MDLNFQNNVGKAGLVPQIVVEVCQMCFLCLLTDTCFKYKVKSSFK